MRKSRQVPLELVPLLSKTHFALACRKPQRWFVFPALPLSPFLGPDSSFHGSGHDTALCCFSLGEGEDLLDLQDFAP